MRCTAGGRLGLLGVAALAFGTACSAPVVDGKDKEAPPAPPGPNSWRMFGGTMHRNMANTVEKGLPASWSIKKGKEANIKWAARLGTMAYGGPVIAGGRIFVGTNNDFPRDPAIKGDKGVLMCFREADGTFLWQIVHDKLDNPDVNDVLKHGVASTPCVDGDRVYYVSNRCEIVCADAEKGKVLWSFDMIKELGVYPCYLANCSPLVAGGLVFAVTGNGVDPSEHKLPAPDAPSFVAVHKDTGKLAWKSSLPGKNIMEGQWSNPAAAEVKGKLQVIFPGGDGWLYGFEAATGNLVWKFDCNPKGTKYIPGGRGDRSYLIATPVIWENKCYVATGNNPDDGPGVGHLWCIDITREPKNAEKDLSLIKDNFDPRAPENKDSGLVWHYGGPILPKPEEGSEFFFGRTLSTVAIHEGLLYATDLVGFFYCLDARTGKKYWDFDPKDNTWASPFYADGKVYMGNDAGDMLIYTHGKELKGEPKKVAMDQSLKVPPVACNGVLYVSTGSHLYAITAK
jgi:outer membrane protein assembly factor BamB